MAGTTRILVVRHGESEWNAVGRWQGHALHLRMFIRVIIGGEDVAHGFDFRQHIDNALCAGKGSLHNMVKELLGNVDAAIGNAVIERRRCRQPLQSALPRIGRYHPMQRDRGGIIHPQYIQFAQIRTQGRYKAAGRRGAFAGAYGG